MIIAVDANEANVDQQVGVSVYTLALIRHFHTQATENLQFVLYVKEAPKPHMPPQTPFFRYTVVGPSRMWLRLSLPAHFVLHRPQFDVFFSPAHYSPHFCPAPIVTTIHDLAYEYFPQEFLQKDLYTLRNWTRSSVRRSKHLIAVSQNTKQDIVRLYDCHPDTVDVVYNGFSQPAKDTTAPESIPKDMHYISYIGTLQPRKNVARLIRAFETLATQHPKLQLVLVGKKGWMYEGIEQALEQSLVRDRIHVTGYVSDQEKMRILRHSRCFVMPSLYEGFNIPLLEAQSVGCSVAASNTSCLPEVGGNACLYFDPTDVSAIAATIHTVLTQKTVQATLAQEAQKNCARFSWEESGTKTLQILQEAATSAPTQ